jgi:uncharacterized protein (TIGR02391 family)
VAIQRQSAGNLKPQETMSKKITAGVKTQIFELCNLLYNFLPLSSYNKNAITFKKIFTESKVHKYLIGNNKKQQLQGVWENVFRYHPKLPFTLIRKIIQPSIDYRMNQRNPLTKKELDKLKDILFELGIDMKAEIGKVSLNEELTVIKVPPVQLVERLTSHPLVKEISSEPLQLFRNGHFNESVRKACERFEVKVQTISGLNEIGKGLMSKCFGLNTPFIPLNPMSTENERGIQEGFQFMSMGAMRGIRNIFSHGDANQKPPEECYEMLLFINWLFRQLP